MMHICSANDSNWRVTNPMQLRYDTSYRNDMDIARTDCMDVDLIDITGSVDRLKIPSTYEWLFFLYMQDYNCSWQNIFVTLVPVYGKCRIFSMSMKADSFDDGKSNKCLIVTKSKVYQECISYRKVKYMQYIIWHFTEWQSLKCFKVLWLIIKIRILDKYILYVLTCTRTFFMTKLLLSQQRYTWYVNRVRF